MKKKRYSKAELEYLADHQDLSEYGSRNRILRDLGYPSYQVYLESELWISIRARAWERDHGRCQVCYRIGNVVHHKRYDLATLCGEDISELVVLCHSHHHAIEFTARGAKRAPRNVHGVLRRAIKKKKNKTRRILITLQERVEASRQELTTAASQLPGKWSLGISFGRRHMYDLWCHNYRVAVRVDGGPVERQEIRYGKVPVIAFSVSSVAGISGLRDKIEAEMVDRGYRVS